jgi:hypothetical protein
MALEHCSATCTGTANHKSFHKRRLEKKTAVGAASALPDVCDEARLLVIEVPVTTTLQLSQIVSPLEAEEWPNPMNDHT